MNRASRVIALAAGLFSRPLYAQQGDYIPTYELPHGREIVAVYFGASTCGPCLLPDVKAAIRAMKPLLAAQAKQLNVSFAAYGVSNDWEVAVGAAFLEPFGPFDQVVLGGNWTNLAIERFIFSDSTATPAIPQVLVFERTITVSDQTITFTDQRLIRRLAGATAIVSWVKAGAPISLAETKRP